MRDAFDSWIGQQVVVHLGFGQIKMSLRGVLVRNLTETLLMKPEAGPKIEIAKTEVLAIGRPGWLLDIVSNTGARH